jgi:hypothetical protein
MKIEATKIVPPIAAQTEEVTLTLTAKEAAHLAHRLNVSSYKTFEDYRKENGLDNYHRHPFADDIIEGLREAGVKI